MKHIQFDMKRHQHLKISQVYNEMQNIVKVYMLVIVIMKQLEKKYNIHLDMDFLIQHLLMKI